MDPMQLYRVAKMYYLDGMNQAEIGRLENLSRSQISRLLEQSRQQGIVRIEVNPPDRISGEKLSELLANALGIQKVLIAPSDDDEIYEKNPTRSIAAMAAAYLPKELKNCHVVGMGWGRTVYESTLHIRSGMNESETLFVPMVGASGTSNPTLQTNTIIDRMAQKLCGRSYFFSMQLFRERDVPMTRLEAQRMRNMQRLWNELDAAVFGLGGRMNLGTIFGEEVSREYISQIEQSEVLGDILSQFFFADGRKLDLQGDYRQMAFDIERLPSVPKTICLAGGEEKVEAIYAGAKAGYFKTLLTDPMTAQLLYKKIRSEITR